MTPLARVARKHHAPGAGAKTAAAGCLRGHRRHGRTRRGSLLPGSAQEKRLRPESYLRNAARSSPGVCKTGTTRDAPAAFRRQATRCPLHKALETDPPSPAGITSSAEMAEPSPSFGGRETCLPAWVGSLSGFLQAARSLPGCPRLSGPRRSSTEAFPSTTCVRKKHKRRLGRQRCPARGAHAYRRGGDSSGEAGARRVPPPPAPACAGVYVPAVFMCAWGRPQPK